MLKFVITASILALAFQTVSAQMVKQCVCDKILPCKQAWLRNVEPCVDSCRSGISKLGDYNTLKQCVHMKDAQIQATINCVQNSYPNACARSGAGKMVPKRHFSTLKLAFGSEMTRMFRAWGVMNNMDSLIGVANSMGSCIQKCASEKTGHCEKKQKCGLDEPADNVVVKQTLQCAVKNGFDTASMKQVCNCLVKGGVKQLAPVCSKINMNV